MADTMSYLHMDLFRRFSTTGDAAFKISDFNIFRSEPKKVSETSRFVMSFSFPLGEVQTLYRALPSGTVLIKPTW